MSASPLLTAAFDDRVCADVVAVEDGFVEEALEFDAVVFAFDAVLGVAQADDKEAGIARQSLRSEDSFGVVFVFGGCDIRGCGEPSCKRGHDVCVGECVPLKLPLVTVVAISVECRVARGLGLAE